MTIAQFSKHHVHLVRQQLEQALDALPKDSRNAELSLIIEEAIEISYEVELARRKGANADRMTAAR